MIRILLLISAFVFVLRWIDTDLYRFCDSIESIGGEARSPVIFVDGGSGDTSLRARINCTSGLLVWRVPVYAVVAIPTLECPSPASDEFASVASQVRSACIPLSSVHEVSGVKELYKVDSLTSVPLDWTPSLDIRTEPLSSFIRVDHPVTILALSMPFTVVQQVDSFLRSVVEPPSLGKSELSISSILSPGPTYVYTYGPYFVLSAERVASAFPAHASTEECVVCLSATAETRAYLRCGHSFHSGCISDWLLVARSCPICRQPHT